MKKWVPFSLVITASILSFILGVVFSWQKDEIQNSEDDIRTSLSWWYKYINPLLECEINTLWSRQKYIPFENETKERIKKEVIETNSWAQLSVYFRNLNNGPWFGINETADFSPASLMKLPILIMYLKWAESFPDILDKKILISSPSEIQQYYVPEKSLEIGKEYSIKDALLYLIAYSDNTAVTPLLSHIPNELEEKVLRELGVPSTEQSIKLGKEYVVSVKEYASFFRILYNASYIENDASEVALNLLSKSTFKTGLRLGVPEDIAISHKFGEREEYDSHGILTRQLHDCGIIYYPWYPYILCIMTKWNTDYTTLETMIRKTSSIVYEEISRKFPVK